MLKYLAFILFFNLGLHQSGGTVAKGDQVCGKWMSEEKNLMLQVYHDTDDTYKAKIIWFNDDPSKPMGEWTDKHNPNPALRSRKILGLNVLRDMKYNADDDDWDGGMIYDAQHGKEWNAAAYIDKQGLLKVKGYWHFKIIGRTMTFKRI